MFCNKPNVGFHHSKLQHGVFDILFALFVKPKNGNSDVRRNLSSHDFNVHTAVESVLFSSLKTKKAQNFHMNTHHSFVGSHLQDLIKN